VQKEDYDAQSNRYALQILEKQKPTGMAATSAVPALPQSPIG
jgi:hypothetical protein